MTNLEPILRKLIESMLFKCRDEKGKHYWGSLYDKQFFKKDFNPDESLDQVVDWFYYHVLQSEIKDQENEL